MEEANAVAAALLAIASERCLDPAGPAPQRQADEVREIGRRLVRNLTRAPFRSYSGAPQGSMLIAEALRPSDAALIDPARIAGVATEEGGTDGHTAIILRALGIPSVLGAPGLLQGAHAGETVLVDGVGRHSHAASVRRQPGFGAPGGGGVRPRASAARPPAPAPRRHAGRRGCRPAGQPRTSGRAADGGAVRCERHRLAAQRVPVHEPRHVPSEDEQAATYRNIIETMSGDPVTIRVLDWGGEKEIEALVAAGLVPEMTDANPALGLRGVRLLLRQPELFETQLAAILRAAARRPGAGAAADGDQRRRGAGCAGGLPPGRGGRCVSAARGCRHRLPPLGIMVETPGAALSADALAAEAEFFAIGTNDLCMYTLAVDRAEMDVAHLYDPLHPAMLRLIQFTTEAANRHHIPCSRLR